MNCVPRPSPKELGNRKNIKELWKFSKSVFKNFKKDDETLLNNCFILDWSRTKVERLIKDEKEKDALKEILKANYKWFRESYKYISGLDPQKDLFCISNVVYSDAIQSMPNMVDGRTLGLADLDLEFIATNSGGI